MDLDLFELIQNFREEQKNVTFFFDVILSRHIIIIRRLPPSLPQDCNDIETTSILYSVEC